ncbi:hypothetical protein AYI69_g6632 [Smittium culicis]|uniref:Uncharacterized protein n=1 Tax=Smittium culicis TaxID=133412 RepID=A0A1R1XY01_9FUNG|nr:hypothetical protein AYI69_g6632 [Smittium culicis]
MSRNTEYTITLKVSNYSKFNSEQYNIFMIWSPNSLQLQSSVSIQIDLLYIELLILYLFNYGSYIHQQCNTPTMIQYA